MNEICSKDLWKRHYIGSKLFMLVKRFSLDGSYIRILDRSVTVLTTVLAISAFFLALGVAFTSVELARIAWSPLPYWDEWEQITLEETLQSLFDQHNEHRLFFPKLIFAADLLFTDGSKVLTFASTIVLQVVHTAVLFYLLGKAGVTGRAVRLACISMLLALLLSPMQVENLTTGFQVQWALTFLASTVSFAILATGYDSIGRVLLACSAAGVACFSMASGVFTPVVLLVLSFVLNTRAETRAIIALSTVLYLVLFFSGYHSVAGHSDPAESIKRVEELSSFLLAYIGAPLGFAVFGTEDRVHAAVLGGIVLFSLAAMTTLLTLVQRPSLKRDARLAVFAVMISIGMSGGATALGRLDFGIDGALASKYMTPALIFTGCTLSVFLCTLLGTNLKKYVGLAFSCFAVFFIDAQNEHTLMAKDFAVRLHDKRTLAGSALLTGVFDEAAMVAVHPNPDIPFSRAEALKSSALSIFAKTRDQLSQVEAVKNEIASVGSCEGALTEIKRLPKAGEFSVSGWADRAVSDAHIVIFDDVNGVVRGYGAPHLLGSHGAKVKWTGYLVTDSDVSGTKALMQGSKSTCILPGKEQSSIVRIEPIGDATLLADKTTVVDLILDDGWQLNGQYPFAPTASFPGAVYGSWVGADENVGSITWEYTATPGLYEIRLPYLSGPAEGATIEGRSLLDDSVIFSHSPSVAEQWVSLSFLVNNTGGGMKIVISDNGDSWGQWVAVGTPRLIHHP